MAGPLQGVKVLDLSRILAGPWATQVLADFGADVIKVERPQVGDDTRQWGPPYANNTENLNNNADAAYFLAANRGKRSLTLDFTQPQGQRLLLELVKQSDVVVENYKVGGLKKYGLDYQSIQSVNSKIIYCSITGFGQTGPYSRRPGYDAIIQGMGGLMSLTGEPDELGGGPQKVGVAVADLTTGMYAVSAIIAALYHRSLTGEGQQIDLALLDTQVSWLANQNMNFLVTGENPKRQGTAHPNIVPYQAFKASDDYFMLAIGNDQQFARFCSVISRPELSEDKRFKSNSQRVKHREQLIALIQTQLAEQTTAYWLSQLSLHDVPSAPINNLESVFNDPQILARDMLFELEHPRYGKIKQVANPVQFSKSKVEYQKPPPNLGEHNREILNELGVESTEYESLIENKIL